VKTKIRGLLQQNRSILLLKFQQRLVQPDRGRALSPATYILFGLGMTLDSWVS